MCHSLNISMPVKLNLKSAVVQSVPSIRQSPWTGAKKRGAFKAWKLRSSLAADSRSLEPRRRSSRTKSKKKKKKRLRSSLAHEMPAFFSPSGASLDLPGPKKASRDASRIDSPVQHSTGLLVPAVTYRQRCGYFLHNRTCMSLGIGGVTSNFYLRCRGN